MMHGTYPVEWKRLFKSLSKFITITILGGVIAIIVLRYVSTGFNFDKTFQHLSFQLFLLILVCTPVLAMAVSFPIALWFRLATITVDEGMIHGRSFWGAKNKIPLDDITILTPFSNNGINAIVVNSKHHGQVYISDKTERLPELLAMLEDQIQRNQQVG